VKVGIGDVRLHVEVAGLEWVPDGDTMRRRPTVVVLHGGPGSDCAGMKQRFGFLSDIAQVVFYDHRGNGRSDDGDRSRWTLAQWGDDVQALCQVLGIERPIVLGTSFGGFVAMSYATRHPEHPGALGLIVTAARKASLDDIVEGFRRLGGDDVAELVRADMTNSTPETSERFRREALPLMSRHPDAAALVDRDMRRSVHKREVEIHFSNGEINTLDFRADLARIPCPTLVLGGEMDPICPPSCLDEIVAALPDGVAEPHLIPGAGHLVFHDAREECERTVRDFVLRSYEPMTGPGPTRKSTASR
jgi:pimeloyl-ACP methyl ester carboxylesterase